jgi:tRNA-splicing endonuclease subunit Sen34
MVQDMIEEPFPIFSVAGQYLLYDVNVVSYVRREHRICGVLTGNLPRANQQNIFCGIPLLLLPEEARLLVVKGHAFVVDDAKAHRDQMKALPAHVKQQHLDSQQAKGLVAAQAVHASSQRKSARWSEERSTPSRRAARESAETDSSIEETLFDSPTSSRPSTRSVATRDPRPYGTVPTVSYPPLDSSLYKDNSVVPEMTPSFYLFAYMHSEGYFLSPGIRFGSNFMAYPGDPLRFHSHFLVVGKQWDEPIDLKDLVAGGRLGTGVKKSFVLGGVEPEKEVTEDKIVRTYCIEWAAM